MHDIITLGSGTIDVFVQTQNPRIQKHKGHDDVCYAIGQKILVDNLHVDSGGGGTNTAVAFARLGLKTGWIGKIGADLHAKTLLDEMKRERVAFLGASGAGMSGYSVILTGLEQNRTILAYKGANDRLTAGDVPWKRLNTAWFYFSAMMGASFGTLKRAAALAKEKGIRYAFNPSMYLAQQGLKALKPVIDGCDVLVLNREEAQALLGTQQRCVEMLPELQKHAKIAVITDGPRTAHASNGIHHYAIEPPSIKVVETTGAGDAFAAGFVAGLILTKDIAEALQWAMAESCSVIQHLGAKQKLLTRNEIRRWARHPAKLSITRL
jgi:ribokinase